MAGFLGPTEMLIVLAAIAALILGPKKLPKLARSLGESKKEFRKSMQEAEEVTKEFSEAEEREKDKSEE